MIPREMAAELVAMAAHYPVVTLVGPRQSGKTMLVRALFPTKPYVNLEKLNERELANKDPEGFLSRFPAGAIIDEVQQAPGLLSYIQVIVDELKIPGQFILTGSRQLELHEAVSQSLAGRTAILKLWPLSIRELETQGATLSVNELLLKGGYANIHASGIDPTKYYSHYAQTYLEKDVRQLINIKNLVLFQRFMKLIAARVACPINASELACELGVSSPTITEWLSVLEASYLIIRLPPYFENFGKRVIKTPKLFFVDVGLACYLLGIENVAQVDRDPLRGRLFENLAVIELVKARLNQGKESQFYFYHNQQNFEIDIIFQEGSQLVPIEIKSSMTFHESFLDGLEKFVKLSKKPIEKSYIIYAGNVEQSFKGVQLVGIHHASRIINEI